MAYKSQNNEAEVVAEYFKHHKGGVLLSLGENDGETLSNSYDLIAAGWTGILVEPGVAPFNKLQHRYARNHTVFAYNFAIGIHTGKGSFCNASDSLLSTTKPEQLEKWKTVTHKEDQVDFYTFNDARDLFVFKYFDFITIDCEGMDWEILQQMNLEELGCQCICVEHNSDMPRYENIKAHCAKYGLVKELLFNGENTILAR